MASSIALLPPHLIDRILGFDDTSYLSMALWMVGNGTLNKLLSESITYVELQNEGEFDVCCLPSYLTNLRSLRHLVVHRIYHTSYLYLLNRKRTVSIVEGLSDTLETILFRFRGSTNIFFPDDPTSTPHVQIDKTFPNLRRLQLDNETVWLPSFILQLPPYVTDLQVVLPSTQASLILDLMRALPVSLQHLTIVATNDSQWSSLPTSFFGLLPPNLVSTIILLAAANRNGPLYGAQPEALAQLPRTLVYASTLNHLHEKGRRAIESTLYADLHQSLHLVAWLPETGPSLPPFISGLTCYKVRDIKLLAAIQTFPLHLETLCIPHPGMEFDPSMIRALPRRLTSLQARFKHFKGLAKDDFPATLRELSIVRAERSLSASKTLLLPQALTSFTHNSILSHKVVNNLPRNITYLNIQVDQLKEHTLPPNLITFQYFGSMLGALGVPSGKDGKIKPIKMLWNIAPPIATAFEHPLLATFPRNLQKLSLSQFVIPISQLQHLPPALTSLTLTRIFNDSLFDMSDPLLLARIKPLSGTENYGLSPSTQKPQATIPDFMPRSLTFLSLAGYLDVPDEAWSRLPKSLTYLALQPMDAFNTAILRYLPLSRIRSLVTRVESFGDDEVALLPPFFRTISISIPPNLVTFTERSLHYYNLVMMLSDDDPRRDVWEARALALRTLFEQDDVEGAKRLLCRS